MKLLLIVVNEEYLDEITSTLIHNGFTATEVASTGEFVKYGDTILLLGIDDDLEQDVINCLKVTNRHVKDDNLPFFGKVSIYVINLDEYAKIIGKEAYS